MRSTQPLVHAESWNIEDIQPDSLIFVDFVLRNIAYAEREIARLEGQGMDKVGLGVRRRLFEHARDVVGTILFRQP